MLKPAVHKDVLANFVEKLLKLSVDNLELCKNAAVKIDKLKSERIEIQKTVVDLQQTQLKEHAEKVRETVVTSVQDSVKTEMRTWSDIVQKNVKTTQNSVATVQKVVRSAIDKNERSNNFVIYGVEEEHLEPGCAENATQIADFVFCAIEAHPKPKITAARRVGLYQKPENNTSGKPRPIKVTLGSPEAVKFVLSKANKLRYVEEWEDTYLAPDRSKEERVAHRKLVAELKQRINEDSDKYHCIRNGKVISVDRKNSAEEPEHSPVD